MSGNVKRGDEGRPVQNVPWVGRGRDVDANQTGSQETASNAS